MKKIFLTLTAILFVGILFTSASPSLDGRAVVAAEGVFPRGYFAKTVGYLPGDSIKVTNPVNGERIDILVIGSLDASDGVAILLSPEAAAALSIKKNSNNLVKLTKRNGTADDVVSGSALITRGDDAEEVAEELEQEEIEAEEIALAEEENEAEEIPESVVDYSEDLTLAEDEAEEEAEEIAEAEDELSDENTSDEVVVIEDEIPEDELLEDNAEELAQKEIEGEEIALAEEEDEENEAEEIPESAIEYSEDLTLAEDEAEEEAEEIAEIEDEVSEDENFGEYVLVEDEIPEDEIFEENIAEEIVQADDDIPEESAELPPEYEYIVADDILDDEEMADLSERVNEEEIPEEFASENKLEKVEEVEIAEEFAESDLVENEISENLADDEAEEIPELAEAEESLVEDEEYEAIVLVPSEENPPAPREEIEDKKEIASSEKSAPAEEKPAPKNEKSYVAATELAPRKYYVQIAVYNEAENVEEVNELYGKRYPLVVLEKGRRKTVMVGPFNVDEYGIILERFKAYGFKDAFVKSTF